MRLITADPLFIAEVKPCSPFTGWRSPHSLDALINLACDEGDIVAVHTHKAWGGSIDLLEYVRDWTKKPILAKGLHPFEFEVDQARNAGANYVLTCNPLVGMLDATVWHEALAFPTDLLPYLPPAATVVVNERRLSDGGFRSPRETGNARLHFTQAKMNVVQASGITAPSGVDQRCWAYIVGTHLPEFVAARDKAAWERV